MTTKSPPCANCNHPLSQHPPDPNRLFAWPCNVDDCPCESYKEVPPPKK